MAGGRSPGSLSEAKRLVDQQRRRTYLDSVNSDNLIWALSLGKLIELPTSDELALAVQDLTGVSRRTLGDELRFLREIRNHVAHNRAVSRIGLEHFGAVNRELTRAIDGFKRNLLYTSTETAEAFEWADHPTAETWVRSALSEGRWLLLDTH